MRNAVHFRESMAWLHTWAGVVLGALLFAIFWMGTLSVFDREIDRWMMPETRLVEPRSTSLDRLLPVARKVASDASFWGIALPSERVPVARVSFRNSDGDPTFRDIDPETGVPLPDSGTLAGTRFIFPFHFNLHLRWMNLGYWLVGVAGMAMLVLLVSGVVLHRKIFADFFTFRWERKLPRSSLDLHNLTGILGLPFHFVITLSGLIIFLAIYFPTVVDSVYRGDSVNFDRDVYGGVQRDPASAPGPLASLDAMATEAARLWQGDPPSYVQVSFPGDANATIAMYRSVARSVDMNVDTVHFDAATGEILHTHTAPPVVHVQRFISGLHFIQFDHWPLRWLYFALGLSGCVMIATGYIYWLESRRKKHAALGLPGVRIVEGLTVGSVTGIVIATLAFFVANRLLPLGASFAGVERAALEVWAFYLVWLATFAHAWARPGAAWREQCRAIAALAILAPLLNWVTTGDHLIETVSEGYWPVAGMDLLLLAGAATAVYAARKLRRRPATTAESADGTVREPGEQHV